MSAPTAQERSPYQLFAVLWAVALLFETARAFLGSGFLTIVLSVMLGRCAALWVLARPGATVRFVALNAAMMLTIFLKLPKMNNHGIFMLVAGATILLAYARLKVADRAASVPGAHLFATFAPALRWELLAMYAWATVHKLNTDFFDLEVSCGPAQLRNVNASLPIVPTGEWLQLFGIYGTLAIEGGIPLLLLFRRTRVAGILLAAGFHYLLGVGLWIYWNR